MSKGVHRELLITLVVASFLAPGCGYTVLKTNPTPQTTTSVVKAVDRDSVVVRLSGSWHGVSTCYDHFSTFTDTIYEMVFTPDYKWFLDSPDLCAKGSWSLETSADHEWIKLNASNSPWGWSLPWTDGFATVRLC